MKNRTRLFTLVLCCIFAGSNSSSKSQRQVPSRGAPAPTVLASGWIRPDQVSVYGANIYWVSAEKKLVKKSGAGPVTLFETSAEDRVRCFAVDRTGLYLLTARKLLRVDPDTGRSSELAETEANYDAIVLDENNVYWIGDLSKGGGYEVIKLDKKGGAPVALASEVFGAQRAGLAVDQANVYWLDYADDTLKSVSKDGAMPVVVTKFPAPQALTVDESYIYCGGARGSIIKLDKKGGAPITVVPEQTEQIWTIVADENTLYYASSDRILKVKKDGGAPTLVARRQPGSLALSVDACCVYWTDYKAGRVMKVNK